jgi:ubiquinone/menaquinone biosynthesis C-methylase UbiE
MNAPEFTGERFVPVLSGPIAYEHWHRYAFAAKLAGNAVVLDAACGEGYGTAFLSSVCKHIWGVELDAEAVRNASAKYAQRSNLQFVQGTVTALPFESESFDLVVSFETIEHIDQQSQGHMLREFSRVLKPEGLLLLSSPNKALHSERQPHANPYHIHELYGDELATRIAERFTQTRWFHQRLQYWSAIWAAGENEERGFEAYTMTSSDQIERAKAPPAMYYLVLAGKCSRVTAMPGLSLFSDEQDAVTRQHEDNARELMRQYPLIDQLASVADRNSEHILHLEGLITQREQIIATRDIALETTRATIQSLSTQIADLTARTLNAGAVGDCLQDLLRRSAAEATQATELTRLCSEIKDELFRLVKAEQERSKWGWWVRYPVDALRRRLLRRKRTHVS